MVRLQTLIMRHSTRNMAVLDQYGFLWEKRRTDGGKTEQDKAKPQRGTLRISKWEEGDLACKGWRMRCGMMDLRWNKDKDDSIDDRSYPHPIERWNTQSYRHLVHEVNLSMREICLPSDSFWISSWWIIEHLYYCFYVRTVVLSTMPTITGRSKIFNRSTIRRPAECIIMVYHIYSLYLIGCWLGSCCE